MTKTDIAPFDGIDQMYYLGKMNDANSLFTSNTLNLTTAIFTNKSLNHAWNYIYIYI